MRVCFIPGLLLRLVRADKGNFLACILCMVLETVFTKIAMVTTTRQPSAYICIILMKSNNMSKRRLFW